MALTTTEKERIARLETLVEVLASEIDKTNARLSGQLSVTNANLQKTNDQLDKLLALQNKGAGAFWLASTLFGTGLVGLCMKVFNWAL